MPVLEHEATNEKGVHLFPLYSQKTKIYIKYKCTKQLNLKYITPL